MRNIICMKWGTKFPASYVNRLAAMVRRHLQGPYRFVCFTDDANGLDLNSGQESGTKIEVRPLPEMELPEHLPERGWKKLTVFNKHLADLEGTALFLDLDVLILDDLEPFFEHPGRFFIIHEWGFRDPVIGNSSVFRFEIGEHADVLEYFVTHFDEVRAMYRNEQAYLSHAMYKKGILEYWPETWCRSFKRSCMKPFPINYFVVPEKPQDAKILIFHGNPTPEAAKNGWIGKYGLRAVRPAPWIAELWTEDSVQ